MYQVVNIPIPNAQSSILERMVFSGLVFNMSWEDPEMDRRAFELKPNHTVLSITSAGCNPLNFLCQNPKRLICVDGNPAQNAVMELKLAAIEILDHAAFFDIFAARAPQRLMEVYDKLRPRLSPRAAKFWDGNAERAARNGIYALGRTGLFCRILRGYLKMLKIDGAVNRLFDCKTLEEQDALYHAEIAPRLWRNTSRLFVACRPLIYLAGVHPKQFQMIDDRHNMYTYLRERIDYACTKVPAIDNYFLCVAATGAFRGNSVPPYLLEENYETLRNNIEKVTVVTGWLGPYLDSIEAGSIDRFNLLDIFDWMSVDAFRGTLESVLRAAAPGARLIYRSGSYLLEPPAPIKSRLHHHEELSKELLAIDRSATYGSFYVYSVKDRDSAVPAIGSGAKEVATV